MPSKKLVTKRFLNGRTALRKDRLIRSFGPGEEPNKVSIHRQQNLWKGEVGLKLWWQIDNGTPVLVTELGIADANVQDSDLAGVTAPAAGEVGRLYTERVLSPTLPVTHHSRTVDFPEINAHRVNTEARIPWNSIKQDTFHLNGEITRNTRRAANDGSCRLEFIAVVEQRATDPDNHTDPSGRAAWGNEAQGGLNGFILFQGLGNTDLTAGNYTFEYDETNLEWNDANEGQGGGQGAQDGPGFAVHVDGNVIE